MWLNDAYAAAIRAGLTGNELAVLTHLCWRAGASGVSTQSIANIAREVGMHRVTCQKVMKNLKEMGLVEKCGSGTKVHYELLRETTQVKPDATGCSPALHNSSLTLQGDANNVAEATRCSLTLHGVLRETTQVKPDATQTNTINYNPIDQSSSKDVSYVAREAGPPPYDQWVSDEFSRFGYHLPIPVSQNIAARTLTAMSREYGEQYITDRLSELTGRPQAAVIKYILQDGAGWLQRKLNPPPAREQRARANRREIYRDPQFVGKPFPVATTDADLDEMFGPDPSKVKV